MDHDVRIALAAYRTSLNTLRDAIRRHVRDKGEELARKYPLVERLSIASDGNCAWTTMTLKIDGQTASRYAYSDNGMGQWSGVWSGLPKPTQEQLRQAANEFDAFATGLFDLLTEDEWRMVFFETDDAEKPSRPHT